MDTEHTRKNGLEIGEVERLIRDVSRFANPKSDQNCPTDTGRVRIFSELAFNFSELKNRIRIINL